MITEQDFIRRFGFEPRQDDLERVNCPEEGKSGHFHCGVYPCCDRPRFTGCTCGKREGR